MTQEQAKLTLVEVEQAHCTCDVDLGRHDNTCALVFARALLASQTALRSGCRGCSKYLPLAQNGTWIGHWGTWDSWFPGDEPMEGTMWIQCKLTEEQRAALLDQGDGDAGANQ